MQIEQLKQLEQAVSEDKDEELHEGDLELLSVFSRATGRNKVSKEEATHLKALSLIKKELTKFDLSKNEVKVYLFLARFGASKAQKIAEALGVHRTEAYKILHRLERQGLVSCVFERPMKFDAIPFEKALEFLIEERRQRIHQLERRKKELVEIWSSLPKTEKMKTRSETFQVLEGKRQINVKANELLHGCSQQLLMVISDRNLLGLYNSPFFDDLDKIANKRRLDARLMTNFSPTSTYVLEQVKLGESDFAYLRDEETPGFLISDKRQILLLMEKKDYEDSKPYAIWTNYESIVKAFNLLFSLLWKKEPIAPLLKASVRP